MERGSDYTARCRSPWGAQVPRAAVGEAPTRPGPAWLASAPPGWAGSAFSRRSPGQAGSDGAEPPPAHCCLRGGGVSRQPAPSPPVPVPVAPAVPTGTASAAEPRVSRRLRLSRPVTDRREQAAASPLPQPGEVGVRARGRRGRGGPRGSRGSRPGSASGGRARPDAPGCWVASCGISARFSTLGLLAGGEPLRSPLRMAQSGQCKDGKTAGYSE